MRAKCSKEKAGIASAVEELNSVSSLCGLPPTNKEEVKSGVFSWSFNESETTLPGILREQYYLMHCIGVVLYHRQSKEWTFSTQA